jgi:lipopolysaccharide/colanic/teichoic acid biosynthesis glycosyltransferase
MSMPSEQEVRDTVRDSNVACRLWSLKYLLEWLVAMAGALVVFPLLIVIALVIKVTSQGPVFYISQRIGRDGKVFRLYKFRTMRVAAEEILAEDGKVVTLSEDPRFTPVGKFLRLGFDELPQLFNILKGDMCLIGPRPDVVWELDNYDSRQRMRLRVLPGITGLTQVMGGRELDNAQNYELDVRYVACSSVLMDTAIALLTVPYSFGAKRIGRRVFSRYMVDLPRSAESTESMTGNRTESGAER